jgi:uncharacterized protein (DUF1015 family)
MPDVRPFRALRYSSDEVPDLATVVSPPYDVVSPERRAALLARDPRNVIAVELPESTPGDEPEDRYRQAARTLAGWRSSGVLRKDPRPSWYVLEQAYRVPETGEERSQRGFLGLVRLVPYGGTAGVLRHERTLDAPREDRYRLLRATGANTSPIVGLYEDPSGVAATALGAIAARPPSAELVDDEGVQHRLWVVPADDPDVAELPGPAAAGPIVIADGHHRYETALRYRDERHMTRSCEEDPPFDWAMMLFLSTAERLTILPTHRLLRGLSAEEVGSIPARVGTLFEVEATDAAGFERGVERGTLGLATTSGCWTMEPKALSSEPPSGDGGSAVDVLDVAVLGRALDRLWGIDAGAVAAGRLAYTTSASEALASVDQRRADAAFLLAPTPVDDVVEVARRGEVMPQKSTHFYPKALAGLVLNPHEW